MPPLLLLLLLLLVGQSRRNYPCIWQFVLRLPLPPLLLLCYDSCAHRCRSLIELAMS
jgi:hypothetical protein